MPTKAKKTTNGRDDDHDTTPTRANYKILKCLMSGTYLQASLSSEARERLTKDSGYSYIDGTFKKLESMGVIVGYIPILSEKGKKLMDALALIYDDETGELAGMMEKMV